MLSAVAARKAAQVAKVAPQAPSPLSETISATRLPSKRKAGPSAPTVKKKKIPDGKTARYFQAAESLPVHDDVIMIDSDVSEDDLEMEDATEAINQTAARVWSPSAPMEDSSDEEENAEDDTLDVRTPLSLNAPSQFRPTLDQNVFSLTSSDLASINIEQSPASVVCLQPGESLAFIGTYQFRVLQGSISILGTTFHPHTTTHNVFAPKSSPIPHLSASTSTIDALPLPPRLKTLIDSRSIVIVLLELRTGIQGLGRVCGTFEGVFSLSSSSFDFGIPGMSMVNTSLKNVPAFQLPPSWKNALESAVLRSQETGTSHVFVVQGAKKSGKSTFARTLTNQLLSTYARVAYLECDLGQSEFTPGGMIALNIVESPLLGPTFSHPSLPIAAHYLGATSPKASPSHYLAAIQDCAETYRLDLQTPIDDYLCDDDARIIGHIPLIVNTMGWTKGLGADLLRKIHELVQPTTIFEVEAPVYDDYWPPSRPEEGVHRLKPIIQPTAILYTASDLRTMNFLSYFHAVFPEPKSSLSFRQLTATSWSTSLPLCAHPPYSVDVSLAIDQVILIGAGAEDVVASEVGSVMNVAVVGLVECENGGEAGGSDGGLPFTQGVPPPLPIHSRCHGLAVVRSLSSDRSLIQMLTPLPLVLLGKTRVLVKGEIELPVWGMTDFRGQEGLSKEGMPYLQWHKGRGVGAEKKRVRKNLMRRGQM